MAKRKNKFEKKKVYQILPDRSGQPIFAGFLLVSVFHLTRTGPATGSTRRRV
jgi:hypothetical protein